MVRGVIGTPMSGKPREIPLGDDVLKGLKALKAHRDLRGPFVFCDMDGGILTRNESKNALAHSSINDHAVRPTRARKCACYRSAVATALETKAN